MYGSIPRVHRLDPPFGGGGTILLITGEGFCGSISDGKHWANSSCQEERNWPSVALGDVSCDVISVIDEKITCVVPPKSPSTVSVHVDVVGIGAASGLFTFEFLISISQVSPTARLSFGGANVTIHGVGFPFLETVAHDRASHASASASAIVGLNAIRASALINRSIFTTPVAQVQLHGLGSAIQYLGCYRDDGSMMTLLDDKFKHHNVASCLAFCSDANFTYSALMMGHQCRCGNTYGPSAGSKYILAESAEAVIAANGEQSKEAQCRMGCSGADDVYNIPRRGWSCGGFERSAVYTRATSVPCSPVFSLEDNTTSLVCRFPPLFLSLNEHLSADAAHADREEICDVPSDSLADKICYTVPKNFAPSGTRLNYTLALANGVCTSDCTISYSDLATPYVASVTPNHGAAGDVVHIQGSGFSNDSALNDVQAIPIHCSKAPNPIHPCMPP